MVEALNESKLKSHYKKINALSKKLIDDYSLWSKSVGDMKGRAFSQYTSIGPIVKRLDVLMNDFAAVVSDDREISDPGTRPMMTPEEYNRVYNAIMKRRTELKEKTGEEDKW